MTKAELAASAAENAGIPKSKAEEIINALIDTMGDGIIAGKNITLVGFGTFSTSKRQARNGRNPQTKEEMKIPASVVPKFKAGKSLKELVNR
ncbi:MAG: HU family DNA-binding protein [SAR324 cluster bacterium]|nr:HU family DNA-binding protein [SAR324 cluster bacterium]